LRPDIPPAAYTGRVEQLRRALRGFLTALLALLLLFEEWGWEPLAAALARLARLPLWAGVERRIACLPPWAALAVFTLPMLALLPIKLLALFAIGRGHALTGLAILLAAKILGTAILARLFKLTQSTLMQLAWFARWYPRWKTWKDGVLAQVRHSALWQSGARLKARASAWWAAFRRRYASMMAGK
jgi:hypothetical protein